MGEKCTNSKSTRKKPRQDRWAFSFGLLWASANKNKVFGYDNNSVFRNGKSISVFHQVVTNLLSGRDVHVLINNTVLQPGTGTDMHTTK